MFPWNGSPRSLAFSEDSLPPEFALNISCQQHTAKSHVNISPCSVATTLVFQNEDLDSTSACETGKNLEDSDETSKGNTKQGAPHTKPIYISSNDADALVVSIKARERPGSDTDTLNYPRCGDCSWSPKAEKGKSLQQLRQAVQKHIKRNHQSHDYQCQVCHVTIKKRYDNLKDHIRRKHPDRFAEFWPESANTKARRGGHHAKDISHLEADKAGLGDPSWHTTKSESELHPGRHATPHKPSLRSTLKYSPAPERYYLERSPRTTTPVKATPNLLVPDHFPRPLETGGKRLQSTQPVTAIPHLFESGTDLVGCPDRHKSPIQRLARSEIGDTDQVAEGSHAQAVKPPGSPLPSWRYGVYDPSYRPASEDGKPAQSSVDNGWDSDIDRQPNQWWYSIATSPRRVHDTVRDQSVATESQTSMDTVTTDDTIQLSWNSDNRFRMRSSHPFLSIELHAVQEVVRCFQVWDRGGGSAAASQSPIPSTSASSQTQQQDKGKGPQKRPTRDGDEPGDDGEDGPPPKMRSRKRVSQGQPRLACPFQKRFPERHPMCGGWNLISHVKQHLRLKHTRSPYYCPRCNLDFKTEEERDEHIELIVSSPCQKRVYDASTEISARVAKQLQKRVESASGLHEQWFSVWDTIFPGIVRPATCTYDISSELPVQVLGLYSYLETEGPGKTISVLQRHGLSIGPENHQPLDPDLDTFTRRVLFQAFREICQDWQTQREQSSSSNPSPTNPSNTSYGNTGGCHTSVGLVPRHGTKSASYTPTSTSNEGSSSMSLPVETRSSQARRISNSSTQSQLPHSSTRASISTLDCSSHEHGFACCASTAADGAVIRDGYTPQDETFSTLQYSIEDGHIADVVFNFDFSTLQNFSSDNEDILDKEPGLQETG